MSKTTWVPPFAGEEAAWMNKMIEERLERHEKVAITSADSHTTTGWLLKAFTPETLWLYPGIGPRLAAILLRGKLFDYPFYGEPRDMLVRDALTSINPDWRYRFAVSLEKRVKLIRLNHTCYASDVREKVAAIMAGEDNI